MTEGFNQRIIKQLKIQVSGETKAHLAAVERARSETIRADAAERRERELGCQYRSMKDRADRLEAILKSNGSANI